MDPDPGGPKTCRLRIPNTDDNICGEVDNFCCWSTYFDRYFTESVGSAISQYERFTF